MPVSLVYNSQNWRLDDGVNWQGGNDITGATYGFTYDGRGARELTRVTFPWGAYLRWDYASFAYLGGRSLREVSARYLAADSAGANLWTYPITRPDATGSVQLHSGMTLTDASGNGAKQWNFLTTGTWQAGLVSDFRQLDAAGSANAITHDSYIWAQNGSGNPYISRKTSVEGEGTANAQSALSTQPQDIRQIDSIGYLPLQQHNCATQDLQQCLS